MTPLLSPLELEVLLHHYYSPNPHPKRSELTVSSAINRFLNSEVMHPNETLTPLGVAWVKTILATPVPRMVFINDKGEVIE